MFVLPAVGDQLAIPGPAVHRQVVSPISELPLEHVALQPFALPGRVVGILDLKFGREFCSPREKAA